MLGRLYILTCIHLNYLTALYYLFMYSVIHLTYPISDAVSGSPYVPLEITAVTALFTVHAGCFFPPLNQEAVLILWAVPCLQSNLYSIYPFCSPQQQPTNQFIVSASQNGCWSSNKQQCKINEGRHIVISISITAGVRGLTWGETEGEERKRENRRFCSYEKSTPAFI